MNDPYKAPEFNPRAQDAYSRIWTSQAKRERRDRQKDPTVKEEPKSGSDNSKSKSK